MYKIGIIPTILNERITVVTLCVMSNVNSYEQNLESK